VREVFEESLVWSVILETILHKKTVRGDLLLCNKWQTSAQACICFQKKARIKSIKNVTRCKDSRSAKSIETR